MLDDLLRQLNGATYDTILVTGHADRFGSAEYNQVEAVADDLLAYLQGAEVIIHNAAFDVGFLNPVGNPPALPGRQ